MNGLALKSPFPNSSKKIPFSSSSKIISELTLFLEEPIFNFSAPGFFLA
jgi:hypothetical protein